MMLDHDIELHYFTGSTIHVLQIQFDIILSLNLARHKIKFTSLRPPSPLLSC